MRCLVFCQLPTPDIPLAALVTAATRRRDATLTVLSAELTDGAGTGVADGVGGSSPGPASAPAAPGGAPFSAVRAIVELESAPLGHAGTFVLRARATTEADQVRARAAEIRGQAAGMASLAARCPTLWEVEALGTPPATALWHLTAVLAIVALGPVLPEDGATLFGVRGSMARAGAG